MENQSRRRVLAAGFAGTALGLLGRETAAAVGPASAPPDTSPPGTSAGTSPAGTSPGDTSATGTSPADTSTVGTSTADTSTIGTTGDTSTVGTTGDTTAASAPLRPTPADSDALALAQGLELAARDLYQSAIDAGAGGDDDNVLVAMRNAHRAYGQRVSGLIGTAAPQQRDDSFYEQWADDFGGTDLAAVTTTAYEMESTLLATHTELVGQLESTDAASSVAAIALVGARLCTVLADLSGRGDDFAALFENEAEPVALSASTEG